MILIYSHTSSARLRYTCDFIFKTLLNEEFDITIDREEFTNYEGVKINYSHEILEGFTVKNHTLLFETGIREQEITCFFYENNKAFFKTEKADIAFDVFAASFYLLSRYEEYLPHEKDLYGRFPHKKSLAFKELFLERPVINIWVHQLAMLLVKKYPGLLFDIPEFRYVPTYDIDIAYSYKHKGLFRNLGGFLQSPSAERIKVLLGSEKDPFDSYEWMDDLHNKIKLNPIYFFLVAENNSRYDKNISPHKDAMWRLVKQHAGKYQIGFHPSYQCSDHAGILQKEKKQLEAMCGSPIVYSRHHYIRFNLPDSYRMLADAGITDDYSMGYGSINGFRASVTSSFYWYDLEKEEKTGLLIHPFCFMDANSFYEQRSDPFRTYNELLNYYFHCKKVNGTLITIWHNNFLGTSTQFSEWKALYEKFIVQVLQ